SHGFARKAAPGNARTSEPDVRRGRRPESEAGDRSRATTRRRRVGQESRLRCTRRRDGVRLRIALASLDDLAAHRGNKVRVAEPAAKRRPHRAVRAWAWPKSPVMIASRPHAVA